MKVLLMNQLSLHINRFKASFWKKEAYKEVTTQRVGTMIVYLAILISVMTVLVTIRSHFAIGKLVEDFYLSDVWRTNQIPEVDIRDGHASSAVAQPYILQDEDFIFILDTTGQTQELDPDYEQGVLVTETEMIYRRSKFEMRRYDLSEFPDFSLNRQSIEKWISDFRAWAWLIIAVSMFIFLWVAKALQLLFGALIGLLVCAITKRSLAFRSLINISILALTPPLVFDLLKDSFNLFSPWFSWLSVGIFAGYVTWGVLAQFEVVVLPASHNMSGSED